MILFSADHRKNIGALWQVPTVHVFTPTVWRNTILLDFGPLCSSRDSGTPHEKTSYIQAQLNTWRISLSKSVSTFFLAAGADTRKNCVLTFCWRLKDYCFFVSLHCHSQWGYREIWWVVFGQRILRAARSGKNRADSVAKVWQGIRSKMLCSNQISSSSPKSTLQVYGISFSPFCAVSWQSESCWRSNL